MKLRTYRSGMEVGVGDVNLQGTRVVIIGGSSGLGLATARAALAKGARVVVTGRSKERLTEAKSQLGDGLETTAVDALDETAKQTFLEHEDSIDQLFVTIRSKVAGTHSGMMKAC